MKQWAINFGIGLLIYLHGIALAGLAVRASDNELSNAYVVLMGIAFAITVADLRYLFGKLKGSDSK